MSEGTSKQDCIELKAKVNVSAEIYGARASEIITLQTAQQSRNGAAQKPYLMLE